jgi:hypothetical protein
MDRPSRHVTEKLPAAPWGPLAGPTLRLSQQAFDKPKAGSGTQ